MLRDFELCCNLLSWFIICEVINGYCFKQYTQKSYIPGPCLPTLTFPVRNLRGHSMWSLSVAPLSSHTHDLLNHRPLAIKLNLHCLSPVHLWEKGQKFRLAFLHYFSTHRHCHHPNFFQPSLGRGLGGANRRYISFIGFRQGLLEPHPLYFNWGKK